VFKDSIRQWFNDPAAASGLLHRSLDRFPSRHFAEQQPRLGAAGQDTNQKDTRINYAGCKQTRGRRRRRWKAGAGLTSLSLPRWPLAVWPAGSGRRPPPLCWLAVWQPVAWNPGRLDAEGSARAAPQLSLMPAPAPMPLPLSCSSARLPR
jgi:hypothetical protein